MTSCTQLPWESCACWKVCSVNLSTCLSIASSPRLFRLFTVPSTLIAVIPLTSTSFLSSRNVTETLLSLPMDQIMGVFKSLEDFDIDADEFIKEIMKNKVKSKLIRKLEVSMHSVQCSVVGCVVGLREVKSSVLLAALCSLCRLLFPTVFCSRRSINLNSHQRSKHAERRER